MNVAVAFPPVTVTDAGTVSAAALLDNPTTTPLAPTAFVIVTVQVDVPPEFKLEGTHPTELSTTGATNEIPAV